MFLYSARARRLICFVASFLLPLREAAEECIGEWALSKWAQFIRDKWNVCNALCKSFREERSGTAAWDAERFAPVLAEQRTVPQVTLTVGDTCRSLHSGKMKRDNVVIQEHVISGDRLYAEFFFFLAFSGCSCSNLRVSWVIDDTWITSLSTRRTPYFVSIGVLWWPVNDVLQKSTRCFLKWNPNLEPTLISHSNRWEKSKFWALRNRSIHLDEIGYTWNGE